MVIDGQRQVLSRFLGSLEKWIVHQHPPIPAWQKSKRESVFLHTSVLAGSSSTPRMSRFILVLRQQSLIKDNFTFRYALITHQHGDDFHLRNVFAEDNQADGQRRCQNPEPGPESDHHQQWIRPNACTPTVAAITNGVTRSAPRVLLPLRAARPGSMSWRIIFGLRLKRFAW